MKKLLPMLLFFLVPAVSFGQGSAVNDVAFKNLITGIAPAAGATVTVCTSAGTGIPCTPLATVYSDIALTKPITPPILADSNGYYSFFAPSGTYIVTVTGAGTSGRSVTYTLPFTLSGNNAFTGNNTHSGTETFTGATVAKNINRTRMVDFANTAGWAGADACAWINSAITDIGVGVLGTVDARGLAGGTSTCTSGTITVPQNITLLLSGTINTNANPGISVTGGTVAGGVSSAIIGTGRFNTLFQCTATTGSFCVSIGDGTNIMRGFTLSDMKIIADLGGGLGGSTIRIRDGANHLTVRNLQLGPVQSCVVFETGAIGQQFQTWDSVRCDGFSGIGFNADLTAGVGGTNLKLSNVYMNASGSTTGTTGFDIRKWVGVTIDTSDTDGNGATGPTVGFKLAGVGGTGTFTVNGTGCETMQAGTICISVVGPGSYTFTSPYIISCAQLIDVSAQSSVTIENPFSSATSGGNDIIFQAGASGGTYEVFGGSTTMSKPTILANGGTLFQQFLGPKWGQQQLFSGTQALPGLAGSVGTTNGFYETAGGIGYSRSGSVKAAFDASGTLDQFEINGAASGLAFCPAGLFGNSCDNFIRRTAAGALAFGNGPANSNGVLTLGGVLPTAAGTAIIGSTALPVGTIQIGTAATNNFAITPAATAAARTVNILDPGSTSTLALDASSTYVPATNVFTGAWICTNVTPVTANANVATDQNLMACTIPAGVLNRVGRTLRVWLAGVYTTPAASVSQMTVKVKLCTVSGCGSGTVITPVSIQSTALASVQVTNDNWSLEERSTTQTAGASSAYEAHGDLLIDLTNLTTGADSTFGDTNTATVGTIDSTAQLFLQCTFAFSTASASNSVTQRQLIAETVN